MMEHHLTELSLYQKLYLCFFPAMTSQNNCSEKGLFDVCVTDTEKYDINSDWSLIQ